jgi:lantibiotic modifying enzyme
MANEVVALRRPDLDPDRFLRTAKEIGHYLARDAVWHQDHCNWMGDEIAEHQHTGERHSDVTFQALKPHLYSGTSGIALFLAELHTVTGDDALRLTALGAIRHALAHACTSSTNTDFGLYIGYLGVALAAARVAALLGLEDLRERAACLAHTPLPSDLYNCEFDLLSGLAGAIVALLALNRIVKQPALRAGAARLGDVLISKATRSDAGAFWSTLGHVRRNDLTGLSHGTAGAGYALLELYRETGEPEYRAVAEQAFQYERSWFNATIGNWPDFRRGHRMASRGQASYATTWCHGAPGITLSRLRAFALLGDEGNRAEAEIGLRTTATALKSALDFQTGNYSLCHGLAGNADLLLYGARILPEHAHELETLVHTVADSGIHRYGIDRRPWPCGIGGETPSLMLGLAGIGYFYLRVHDPTRPSVLLIQPEQFDCPDA